MVFNKIDLLRAGVPAGEQQDPAIHGRTFRETAGAVEGEARDASAVDRVVRRTAPRIDPDHEGAPRGVWLSAATGEGLDLLKHAIGERLAGSRVHAELRLPPRAGRLRARLIELGAVESECYDDEGWRLDIDFPRELLLPLAGDVRGDDARLLRDWLDAA
jgi:hypothetical protein